MKHDALNIFESGEKLNNNTLPADSQNQVKRVYAPPSRNDGFRVLVDRHWPRGGSRSSFRIDLWIREIAPSKTLCKMLKENSGNWDRFCNAYQRELQSAAVMELLKDLISRLREGRPLTLLFASCDRVHNHAEILKSVIRHDLRK